MPSQHDKALRFRALHENPGIFMIPNVWDGGSASVMAGLGFEALATSSAACAATLGKLDGGITREEALAHARLIVAGSPHPVAADLENGFGDAPESAAETIRLAAAAGAVGGSIEDATGRADHPIYETDMAADRIRAAAEIARGLGFPFMLTARAENYLHGRRDLKDTIGRLQAYQEAGADVLYAPGVTSKDEIATLVRSVDRPVNVLMGLAGGSLNLADLPAMGG